MADIELVVTIPEEDYLTFSELSEKEKINDLSYYERVIANGTPLPKGHGDLKDAEKLKHAFITWSTAVRGVFTDVDIASIIYNSPTIIEADGEVEE